MFKVEEYDSLGDVLWYAEGSVKELVLPMLSQLTSAEMTQACNLAEALKKGTIILSVVQAVASMKRDESILSDADKEIVKEWLGCTSVKTIREDTEIQGSAEAISHYIDQLVS